MQGAGEAKMPGGVPLPLYGQRACAAVIAGLGWFGVGVELYLNIHDALVKNLPLAGYLIDYFSFFTIEINLLIAFVLTIFCLRPQAEQFLTGPSVTSALLSAWSMRCCCGIYGTHMECSFWPTLRSMMPSRSCTPFIG
jgi:hypothetical protein